MPTATGLVRCVFLVVVTTTDLFCRLCSFPWDTKPWVRVVRQRRTPLTFLPKKLCSGERIDSSSLVTSHSATRLELLASPMVQTLRDTTPLKPLSSHHGTTPIKPSARA